MGVCVGFINKLVDDDGSVNVDREYQSFKFLLRFTRRLHGLNFFLLNIKEIGLH